VPTSPSASTLCAGVGVDMNDKYTYATIKYAPLACDSSSS
jgi:hypothetical protein